ncbi:Chitin binding protein [Methanosarcina siciliae T4/M]|uniref:Chitin binding protein n=1 Tax=Methanosarcina siciliae T4/M TaxID=1434120 RepID=A0A0E3P8S1_9EURY|nr:leucine-rich repeat protein [Methanosarcina siciliae]AKB30298.1 Chitin binding protein [Methanosarcina siciliae T4/M]
MQKKRFFVLTTVMLLLSIAMLAMPAVATGEATITRTITPSEVSDGDIYNVTLTVSFNTDNDSIVIHEALPADWNLTEVDSGRYIWNTSEEDYTFLDFYGTVNLTGVTDTITYSVTVPDGTVSGTYDYGPSYVAGESASEEEFAWTVNTTGDDTVTINAVSLNIYSTAMENTNPGAPDPGIPANSTRFTTWASKAIDYSPSPQEIDGGFANPNASLGYPAGTYGVVCLGDLTQEMIDSGIDPGSIIVGFNVTIVNGDGHDFAVFENGFGTNDGIFGELGYVEVSTNGVTFARFPSISLTSEATGGYGTFDSTDIYNLAGKHAALWGTPFDLSDLAQSSEVLSGAVDLDNINYVRVVDIPGTGDFKDSLGNPIYDAWLTWGTGGFDLDAVGVINSQPKALDGFSASPTSGNAPLTVQFTDLSVGTNSWAWDFDNDGDVDSTEQNPTHIYETRGTYAVRLNVTYSEGSDEWVKTAYITVNTPAADYYTYTSSGSSITITGYSGPGGDVIIPGEIEGLPVTAIDDSVFMGYSNMTSVTLPDNVTGIGNNAFQGCTNLTSVTFGDSITEIGSSAFQSTGLTSVVLPDSVTSMGSSVFQDCTGLTSVTIGNGTSSIPDKTFYRCDHLTSMNISDSVTSIGKYAFRDCTNLTSVVLPDSVTSIGAYAFEGCTALTSITIPDSVTSIDRYAFRGCTALTSATIGSGVTGIGRGVFYQCTNLASVTIPDNVTEIGNDAFHWCNNLTSMTIGNNVTTIGSNAFNGCTGLSSVTIPDSVTTINDFAFSGCTNLTSITLPNSVISIGNFVFQDCSALTSVTFGSGLTSIGSNVFQSCTALNAINVDANNTVYTSIDGIVYNKDVTAVVLFPSAKAGSLVIPDSVTSISSYAFYGCAGLTSVTIGNSVTTIGDQAFNGCTALTSITIPDRVTEIGICAFQDCSALTSATFGTGLLTIGENAFNGCTNLTSAMIPNNVTTIGKSAFNGCTNLVSVMIGSGVTSIGANAKIAFHGCTALTEVSVDAANTAYSSIDGVVYDKAGTTLVFCPEGKSGSFVIPDSVTSIGAYAFNGCTNLTSVMIPNSVTSIGLNAFEHSGLTSVTIPNSVTSWGSNAFRDCSGLTSVNIPGNGATTIGNHAFSQCTNLTSVTIGDGVTSIGSSAFYACNGLTSITIPNSVITIGTSAFDDCPNLASVYMGNVTNIGASAFRRCTALTSVTIPGSVDSMGNNAFEGCTNLTSVTLSDGVRRIGMYAFQDCSALTSIDMGNVTVIQPYAFKGCTALTSVTIPDGATYISASMFYGCTALTSVTIPDSVTNIGASAFYDCTALTSMKFMGNAPTVGLNWANECTDLVAYYYEGATGFTTPTWNGVTCYPLTAAPVADFEAEVTSGIGPMIVNFTDLSTGSPDTWEWDFNNDGTVDSTEQNPSYTYTSAGTYTVNLTVANANGTDSEVKIDYITVSESSTPAEPVAAFTADVTSGTAPLTVNFTDQSTGSPTAWAWDFDNDGNVDSTEQNPSYTYNAAGNYTVNLTVENAAGTDFELKSDYIEVSETSGLTVTLYFDPESSSVSENESTEISVLASNFPAGLSGYNLTVAIDDPAVAEIINIEYPSWALITENSTLPGTSIYLKAVDGGDTVQVGAADVVLATLTVSGKEKGSANLSIEVDRLDDDSGNVIEPALLTGKIEVTLQSPLPDQEYAPKDLDGDGLYEDLTGNGEFSFVDIVAYFHNMDWIEANMPVEYFDFNGNGRIDFDDVVDMFAMI